MKFEQYYNTFIIIALLVLIISTSFLFDLFTFRCEKEGLIDTVPIATVPSTGKLIRGFYQVDDESMAIIPYGFGIDPTNQKKIIPVTKIGYSN